ncbi:hypothetical protein [Siccirubricoccus deserti]|uniref:Uncharacterized protein n=1 Tax=Siccirubricoccus deserti TaxID=2013562 RepID=A0A9X0R4E4_9PROT|nr:hypothetical protein [Siccirubricoccus deserti]MBC4018653.1 hypothetical protein [Siccirubricoccus deserti]
MEHAEFERCLRRAYKRGAPQARPVRLPSPKGIRVSGDPSCATLHLSSAAVLGNMQEDASAFEGWALVLVAWCGVGRVLIDWDVPDSAALDSDPGHYQRFLYRVHRFAHLLGPDRVGVCREDRLSLLRVGLGQPAVFTVAGEPRIANHGAAPGNWRGLGEDALERWLTAPDSPACLRLMAGLGLRRIDRQFPVGIFAGKVAGANRVFPAARSAIDIIGIGENRALWLMELKAGRNAKVGALSELFFYSMAMHDALTDRGCWRFADPVVSVKSCIQPEDVQGCDRIEARLMEPPIHPLLDPETEAGRRVFGFLNDGAARLGWKVAYATLDLGQFLDPEPPGLTPLRPDTQSQTKTGCFHHEGQIGPASEALVRVSDDTR